MLGTCLNIESILGCFWLFNSFCLLPRHSCSCPNCATWPLVTATSFPLFRYLPQASWMLQYLDTLVDTSIILPSWTLCNWTAIIYYHKSTMKLYIFSTLHWLKLTFIQRILTRSYMSPIKVHNKNYIFGTEYYMFSCPSCNYFGKLDVFCTKCVETQITTIYWLMATKLRLIATYTWPKAPKNYKDFLLSIIVDMVLSGEPLTVVGSSSRSSERSMVCNKSVFQNKWPL